MKTVLNQSRLVWNQPKPAQTQLKYIRSNLIGLGPAERTSAVYSPLNQNRNQFQTAPDISEPK